MADIRYASTVLHLVMALFAVYGLGHVLIVDYREVLSKT